MPKKPKNCYKFLENGTVVEILDPVPAHRITGVNAYKSRRLIEDTWADTLRRRKEKDPLMKGAKRVKPTNNFGILTTGYGQYKLVNACQ